MLLGTVLHALALEDDAAVGLEDRRADLVERLVALTARDPPQLGLRYLLAPHRPGYELAVLDEVARGPLEEAVRPREAVRERLERPVDPEQRERSHHRAGHRV